MCVLRNRLAFVALCCAFVAAVPSPILAQEAEAQDTAAVATADTIGTAADSAQKCEKTALSPKKTRLGIGAAAGAYYLIPMDDECKAIMHNYGTYAFDLYAELKTSPAEHNAYDAAFGFPT